MLWWICALSSCICGSEGEEERRASLSIMTHLAVSVYLRDVTLGDVVLCGGVQDLAEQGFTRAAGGKYP